MIPAIGREEVGRTGWRTDEEANVRGHERESRGCECVPLFARDRERSGYYDSREEGRRDSELWEQHGQNRTQELFWEPEPLGFLISPDKDSLILIY